MRKENVFLTCLSPPRNEFCRQQHPRCQIVPSSNIQLKLNIAIDSYLANAHFVGIVCRAGGAVDC